MKSSNWFGNAIIYHILIDRFSGCKNYINTPDFLGGNLKGISDKLDYLSELGINTIWLSPFYTSHQYHGYHITNYKEVDPHFGTLGDLKNLIEKAHEMNIRVIADFVPNHCSKYHPFFLEAQKDINSKYHNWFYFNKLPDDYLCFLDFKELPKLNLDFAETRNYILEIANYWLSIGLDGYRVDHIIGPSHDFWKYFYKNIKTNYPEAILFGEAWGEGVNPKHFKTLNFKNKFWRRIFGVSQENLQLEYYSEFDGILDFTFNKMIVEEVKNGKDFLKSQQFLSKVEKHFKKFPNDYFPVIFLDNHDMDRFLKHCNNDYYILLQAIEFLLSLKHPIVIYYGTETGMYNKTPVEWFSKNSDLLVREPFDWNKVNYEFYNKLSVLLKKNNNL